MSMPKLLGSVIVFGTLSVVLIALFWWRYSVDEKLGYCQTPEQTCINRQGFALGEPCECHGMGGGVFGLDSTGKVVAAHRVIQRTTPIVNAEQECHLPTLAAREESSTASHVDSIESNNVFGHGHVLQFILPVRRRCDMTTQRILASASP